MRIIAGNRRGKKLFEKVDAITRPTKDRVRESVFDVLAGLIDLNGAKVLDLFAGCGAYGLESYSRAAAEVIFNDSDRAACEVIKKNCKLIECSAVTMNLDFREALGKLGTRKFDLIFLDPPYRTDFSMEAIEIIKRTNMLAENGVIVVETEQELKIPLRDEGVAPQGDGVGVLILKKYGRTLVYFVKFV